MDPFAERDAFVNQIGQQRINNQIAFNTSGPQAPQGSPFINYDMARQNASLAGGAPSMNANPADTFIGRFNNQYGSPINPGFGGGQSQQAYYPGGPGGFPTQPGFGGGPTGPPATPRRGPADDFEQVGDFGTAVVTHYYNPETGQRYSTPYGNIVPKPGTGWVRGTGPSQSPGQLQPQYEYGTPPRPPPQSPGRAQPIAQPPQGTPYAPASVPSEGATRTDPSTGKPVKYENGQWSWRPNPVSGIQPYDPSRFGDGPTPVTAPPPKPAGPAWFIPPQHRDEYSKYLESQGPRYTLYDPVRDRQEYEQWAASTGRAQPIAPQQPPAGYNPGMPSPPAPTPPPTKPKSRISGMSVASHVAALEKSYQKQFSDKLNAPKPPPSEAQRLADQEYYRRESERRRADYDVARISNDRFWTAHHAAKNSPAYKGGRRLK
jgi:hypothetical protein